MRWRSTSLVSAMGLCAVLAAIALAPAKQKPSSDFLGSAEEHARQLLGQGEQIFRFDTFGDEAFWGDQLGLHKIVAAISPRQALDLGLKVDAEALPRSLVKAIEHGKVDLGDPAVTVQLLKANAVLGVVGFFNPEGGLQSVGLTCAVCHSTVDDSVAPGVGKRIDGLANRDLNVGAIVASVPNLQPVLDLLRLANPALTVDDVRRALLAWGPGKFDAELFLDGKAFQPNGMSAATLIPNARGLAGHNLHTWTGGWGTVTYWNAFVAVNELHGVGTFFDERFDNADQFPIAAKAGLGHVSTDPDSDRVTGKLPALHFYQLALPAVAPRPGIDFDPDAAERGDQLFSGKAACNRCHREPLWTEPGWNQHSADELRIDSFEADRSPGHAYRTMNLAGIFVRERGLFMRPENAGRFYHDGRFQTLLDVVKSYDGRFGLGLTDQEKSDLVEYLKSL
jgi:cytochrome c5